MSEGAIIFTHSSLLKVVLNPSPPTGTGAQAVEHLSGGGGVVEGVNGGCLIR